MYINPFIFGWQPAIPFPGFQDVRRLRGRRLLRGWGHGQAALCEE
jgi:hypothetical protein